MKINQKDLSVTEAVAKERVRAVLCKVLIEPGKLIGSDGYILLVREIEQERNEKEFKPTVIEPDKLKAAVGKKHANLLVKQKEIRIKNADGAETILEKSNEVYPDYRRIIPAEEREEQKSITLDPALLIKVLRGFSGIDMIKITIVDEESVVRLDGALPDGRKVIGAIMPLRPR